MSICVVADGKFLYVRDEWQTGYNKPEEYRLYWPTGLMATEYPELVDKPATQLYPGIYRINGLTVALEEREKTKPAKVESRNIPKPNGKKEWRGGKWR
jgi:hypothetical protein